MDEDTDGPAAHDTADFAGEDTDVLDFGDSDQSDSMQESMEGALMSTNFGLVDLEVDTMDGLVDPALESTPTQNMFIQGNDDETDIPEALIERPDIMSSMLSNRHLSITIGSSYASEYFRNAHPMWPFLHQKQWDDCWRRWESPIGYNTGAAWMDFFADMVLSIGALLAQNSDPAPEHLESFKHLKDRALQKYESHERSGWSALLRTQSSLLLTIQAMHMDSVGTMCDRASEAIKQCTITKLQRQSNQMPYNTPNDIQDEIQRQATRCCYTIDVLISSSTDQMVTADRFLDEDLLDDDSTPGDASSPETTMRRLNHEDHMFQLRRIQYRILKLVQKLEKQAHRDHHPVPNLWRSQIRHRLDRWVDDIVMFSGSERTLDRFKSQTWLLKLANYATISLFPNPHLAVRSGDARHLVTAACQVLVTFRRFRVREHLSCYTWTALIHQFQAGVIMLYCLWATPTHQQLSLYDRRSVCRALFACSATLVDYANKWTSAHVFQNVFDLLTEEIPISEYGDPMQQWTFSPDSCTELLRLSRELERLQVQRKVVSLLRDMARGSRPCYSAPSIEETQWIQYIHPDRDTDDLIQSSFI
ncbi:hypothetical protein PFICI_08556 [Pestalotiopsis fici W106-1]|uniref:Xylanolytic transcriptional activator regulatory domain-containing protein n=1 Tax=Pestalotiopsis fici (strain W106-1 / CGMCC3.15140) TaxID=1229662 RepID=W3WXW6_PESFW|nr:uncharacterized protein PFICI_08556 [Pestalotiopsis fici W106-1]ETS78703.1 hypothetical protein PFICI_08556 [Pestalotiopsis fici W106-1]